MHPSDLERLARSLLQGDLAIGEFVSQLSAPLSANLGEAMVDLDRKRRCGFPEVVFGQGKSVESLEKIFGAMLSHGSDVFATRISPEQAERLLSAFSAGQYNATARTFRIAQTSDAGQSHPAARGRVAVITAGTSDLPVAEEARETAAWMGADVSLVADVGVAGPHRLPARLPEIVGSDAVVVVAGMEGALPSVVGGYVDCPVIAVPTSVGYGASLGGFAALLTMLNCCAANVSVVNIDAGFKGGYMAGLIAMRATKGTKK